MSVPESLRFTYEDYLLLPEDRRYEIVDGELFLTPAPTPYHQTVAMRLGFLLHAFVERQDLGQVFIAPCDVVLSRFDVLQPDIFFVSSARAAIIGEKFISEAPDLVVEVLSPSTADRDQVAKAKQYARFGVGEMWIADPKAHTIDVFVNSSEGFRRAHLYAEADVLRSAALPGLEVPLDRVF
ncbi:MAG: Uma2 family endonuclease [Acidobacteriota bacterium]|nr:Uma2 family endonuclease [Acidobacteriota bacterium]MDQ5872263.1 Uma2 family endonuclease [Acidobacteriota bacterium]